MFINQLVAIMFFDRYLTYANFDNESSDLPSLKPNISLFQPLYSSSFVSL